jgi:hypothetical protein
MRARSFLHVSLGILALAAAYHLGARSATAQAPGNSVAGVSAYPDGGYSHIVVATANGDVYGKFATYGWENLGNVFSGGPTPARQESFGAVKARYR